MLWDTHMHTHFSTDSDADTYEMIRSSIKAGVDGICFTDHLDIGYDTSPEKFMLDIPAYFKEMQAVQTEFQNEFPVCAGIEIGLQPYLKDVLPGIIKEHPFDFVIGSSHVVHGQDPYYPEYYTGKTEDEAYREYFESILENLAVFDCFDSSVAGLAMDTDRKAPLCVQTLENTFNAYPGIRGAIIHSDRGRASTPARFTAARSGSAAYGKA